MVRVLNRNRALYKHAPNSGNSQEDNPEPRQRNMREGAETRRSEATRLCKVCYKDKPITEFYKKDQSGRLDVSCKACRIITTRERTLGVTQEQYLQMLTQQGSKCGICRRRLYSRRYRAFCVDHCHTTGRIRGLLCHNCNRAIGMLQESPDVLQRAIEWLKV